ncbi:hypothetical protein EOL94_00425 [bacterium]|nr:hypothetical protein [bacterium]
MKKIFSFLIIIVFVCTLAILSPAISVSAQAPADQAGNVPTSTEDIHLTNPLSGVSSPQVLIGRIINSVLGVVGSLALLMFVYGGITWMTSSGSSDKVKKGRDILVWSIIGLAVIFMSYAIVKFVIFDVVKSS